MLSSTVAHAAVQPPPLRPGDPARCPLHPCLHHPSHLLCPSPIPQVRWYSFQFILEQLEDEFDTLLAALDALLRELRARLT
jgi:hypothetical protein